LLIGQAHFRGDQPFSDEAFPFYGSFLITPWHVPVPGAAILFATGVIGLVRPDDFGTV
jgi:hypothetical protein